MSVTCKLENNTSDVLLRHAGHISILQEEVLEDWRLDKMFDQHFFLSHCVLVISHLFSCLDHSLHLLTGLVTLSYGLRP